MKIIKLKVIIFNLLVILMVPIVAFAAHSMPPVKYLLYFKVYNSLCITYINDIKMLRNYYEKGPLTAGWNATPFLENGKNSLSVSVASLTALQGNPEFAADARCELTITAATINGETEVAKVIATVDDKLQPTGILSPDYQGKQGNQPVKEMPVEGTIVYQVTRDFEINGIPEWAWTKATQFEPTEENIAKLRQAYLEMWQLFDNKDSAGIQQKTHISFSEKEMAEGLKAGSWYRSLDYDEDFVKSGGAMPFEWDEFELQIFNQGRLVKLDSAGFSPLRLVDKDGNWFSGYSPYFSLINGEMVITR